MGLGLGVHDGLGTGARVGAVFTWCGVSGSWCFFQAMLSIFRKKALLCLSSFHFGLLVGSPQRSAFYVKTLHCGLLSELVCYIVAMKFVLLCCGLLFYF